jgi:hypothetical protein
MLKLQSNAKTAVFAAKKYLNGQIRPSIEFQNNSMDLTKIINLTIYFF